MVYFQNPEIPIWVNFGNLGMEKVGIFYGHLEYIVAMWSILWPFGIYCGHLVYCKVIW
jgi:hypothetical protein